MAIIVSHAGKDFVPAPEGMHTAVCCDVLDLGMQETQWGNKRMVKVRWQTEDTMEDGKPFLIQKRYTASLHPKATLRQDLESWRGQRMTEDEAAGFDLEKLIGINCTIQVLHARKDDLVFANVKTIVPPMKGAKKLAIRGYIRETMRENGDSQGPESTGADDEVVPF